MAAPPAFPPGFRFGAATAAFQIEGAADADGRADSVWDVFCRRPGAIRTGEDAVTACDHYHRYAEDIRIMADLGIRHYRCSISWPRVMPEGRGAVNERGVDFYRRLFDELQRHGIEPHVTLYHWDTPQALEDAYGGWLDRRIVGDFAAYAEAMVRRLGDRVRSWFTLNEIGNFTWTSYPVGQWRQGCFAPGRVVRLREVLTTVHHALMAHGQGAAAIRAASPQPCRISLADNPLPQVPVTESAQDVAAAARAYAAMNGSIATPLLTGRYGEAFVEDMRRKGEWPDPSVIRPGDLDCLRGSLDTYSVNAYSASYVKAVPDGDGWAHVDPPRSYWRIAGVDHLPFVPECLYWAVRHARDVLGWQGPVVISESGCPSDDRRSPDGAIDDVDRVLVLRQTLRQVERLLAEGHPVEGYFLWSLLDNFEWAWGYAQRYGLVHVDFATQRRTPRLSARWYAETIRQRRTA